MRISQQYKYGYTAISMVTIRGVLLFRENIILAHCLRVSYNLEILILRC